MSVLLERFPRTVKQDFVSVFFSRTNNSGSTNSTTFVDFPGPVDIPIIKQEASTKLLVQILGSSFTSNTLIRTDLGIRINGIDTHVVNFFHNDLGRHDGWGGINRISLAPGSYTARLRWAVGFNPGTISVDGNDTISVIIQEVRSA